MSATAPAGRSGGEVVSIAIARDPALVRTVRLVAAAVARRSGQDEGVVEEIRLAVGEACAVMIGPDTDEASAATTTTEGDQVRVGLTAARDGFSVSVTGRVGAADTGLDDFSLDPWMLLRGLDENLVLDEDADGDVTTVTVSWPAA
jgi:hypothetical protein